MENNDINLIGIAGKIGSGKDTVAKMIQYLTLENPQNCLVKKPFAGVEWVTNETPKYQIKAFSDKVKDSVSIAWGIEREKLNNRDFKDNYCLNLNTREIAKEVDINKGMIFSDTKMIKTYIHIISDNIWIPIRTIIQYEGTDIGRYMRGWDCWINALFADYMPEDSWIITDVRFINECEAIKNRDGIIIKLLRNIENKSTHKSEKEVEQIEGDFTIDNRNQSKIETFRDVNNIFLNLNK